MNAKDSSSHSYDALFYEYQQIGSARSARAVLPNVVDLLGPQSVLDVGCGAGAWLAECERLHILDIAGVDGEYVDRSILMFHANTFTTRDIAKPFDFRRQYDLVQCLEVGEHVPAHSSEILVDNIVRHGKRILFSAAVPGQGGEDHINEQPYEFWRDLFQSRGYRLFDFIRPAIQKAPDVEPWYRYNILFFAHDDVIGSLPAAVTNYRIPDESVIRDFSPMPYRIQKMIVRLLPNTVASGIAKFKHKLVLRSLRTK